MQKSKNDQDKSLGMQTHLNLFQIKIANSSLPPKLKNRAQTLVSLLQQEQVSKSRIQEMAFSGLSCYKEQIPGIRPLIWKILLEYLGLESKKWDQELHSKREVYSFYVEEFLGKKKDVNIRSMKEEYKKWDGESDVKYYTEREWKSFVDDIELWDKIEKDVNRTRREMIFLGMKTGYPRSRDYCDYSLKEGNSDETHREVLKRLLFSFSKANKALGYIQGMNEVAVILYHCFYCHEAPEQRKFTEADSFWCMFNLISSFKEHYIRRPKPQIGDKKREGHTLSDLFLDFDDDCRVCIPEIKQKLAEVEIANALFAYRWFLVFFAQDFSVPNTMRIWDSFFCFYSFVSSEPMKSFLKHFAIGILFNLKDTILEGEMVGIINALQKPDLDVERVLNIACKAYQKSHKSSLFLLMKQVTNL